MERVLSRVHGVSETSINLKTGRIVVGLSEVSDATDDQLRKAIKACGFTLKRIEDHS